MPPPVISPGTCEVLGPDNARPPPASVASARSAPRRSRRFADFARPCSPAYPQINHHNALCFVIRAKQGDNPARTRLLAPVLSAINQPAGSTERINGPATRSSTIHCSSCRCERALRRWLVSSLRRVAAMLAGVVVSRASPEAPHSVPFPSGQGG